MTSPSETTTEQAIEAARFLIARHAEGWRAARASTLASLANGDVLLVCHALLSLHAQNEQLRMALEDCARKIEARSELYTDDDDMFSSLIAHCRAAAPSGDRREGGKK